MDDNKLLDLLDPNYPLLISFRDVCPGTHKHSQSLVSMMERVANDLNIDVIAMKVAAMYHDIGKMANPKYFTENQSEDEDPHKDLPPEISYQLITSHVPYSTAIIINDTNFPREIIEIISQHHGTTITKYFFDKSKCKNEDDYRYKCFKPNRIESAILMICDQIEAISRSHVQADKYKPEEIINNTINYLIDDGQLNDVTMKIGNLGVIKASLAKELEGMHGKRVDYDKANKK